MGSLSVSKVAGFSIMLGPIIGIVGYFLQTLLVFEGNDPTSGAVIVPLINANPEMMFISGLLVMFGLIMILTGIRYLAANLTGGGEALSGYIVALVSIGVIGWIIPVGANWTIAGLDMATEGANAGPTFAIAQGINTVAGILFGLGFLILAYCISQGDSYNKMFAYIGALAAAVLVAVQVLSAADVLTDGQLASTIGGICFIVFTLWSITIGREILSE